MLSQRTWTLAAINTFLAAYVCIGREEALLEGVQVFHAIARPEVRLTFQVFNIYIVMVIYRSKGLVNQSLSLLNLLVL